MNNDTQAAADLLKLVRDNPTLLPPAPDPCPAAALDHRRLDEHHMCLSCGDKATLAYVASTSAGQRFLDLCRPCSIAVTVANA